MEPPTVSPTVVGSIDTAWLIRLAKLLGLLRYSLELEQWASFRWQSLLNLLKRLLVGQTLPGIVWAASHCRLNLVLDSSCARVELWLHVMLKGFKEVLHGCLRWLSGFRSPACQSVGTSSPVAKWFRSLACQSVGTGSPVAKWFRSLACQLVGTRFESHQWGFFFLIIANVCVFFKFFKMN